MKYPSLLVIIFRSNPILWFASVTTASPTGAPEGSRTVPLMAARPARDFALAPGANKIKTAAHSKPASAGHAARRTGNTLPQTIDFIRIHSLLKVGACRKEHTTPNPVPD